MRTHGPSSLSHHAHSRCHGKPQTPEDKAWGPMRYGSVPVASACHSKHRDGRKPGTLTHCPVTTWGAGGPSGTTTPPHQATAKGPLQKPQREMFSSSTSHQNPGERQEAALSWAATAPTSLLTQRDHKLFCPLHTLHPSPEPAPWAWEASRGDSSHHPFLHLGWSWNPRVNPHPPQRGASPLPEQREGGTGRRHPRRRLGPGTFITWQVGGRGLEGRGVTSAPVRPVRAGVALPRGPAGDKPGGPGLGLPAGEGGASLSQLGPVLLLSESCCATHSLAPRTRTPSAGLRDAAAPEAHTCLNPSVPALGRGLRARAWAHIVTPVPGDPRPASLPASPAALCPRAPA